MNNRKSPQLFSTIASGLAGEKNVGFGRRLGQLLSLKKKWEAIAGKVVADNVQILTVKEDGTLILGTESSVWLSEINCLRVQILRRIKEFFPKFGIEKIKVKIVQKLVRKSSSSSFSTFRKKRKLSFEKKKHMKDVLQSVSDDKLQEVLKRIFIKSSENDSDD